MPDLSPRQKDVALLAGGGAALGAVLWVLLGGGPRAAAARAAKSQIGRSDASLYWKDVLPAGYPPSSYPKDWCGGFVLWALHQAGLGEEILWQVGSGFLSRLPITATPQIGDIAYFTNNQHHAMVVDVTADGRLVDLVNGNGTAGKVSPSTVHVSQVAAFYSIQGLVDAAGHPSLWLLGGAAVAGAAAWRWIR